MKKTISQLFDSLSVVNIKIFFLIEKIQDGKATMEEAQKAQLLNRERSDLMNAISREFKERERIKVQYDKSSN